MVDSACKHIGLIISVRLCSVMVPLSLCSVPRTFARFHTSSDPLRHRYVITTSLHIVSSG
jgi:hypothetical protein